MKNFISKNIGPILAVLAAVGAGVTFWIYGVQ